VRISRNAEMENEFEVETWKNKKWGGSGLFKIRFQYFPGDNRSHKIPQAEHGPRIESRIFPVWSSKANLMGLRWENASYWLLSVYLKEASWDLFQILFPQSSREREQDYGDTHPDTLQVKTRTKCLLNQFKSINVCSMNILENEVAS
jgi:hypothetical protein